MFGVCRGGVPDRLLEERNDIGYAVSIMTGTVRKLVEQVKALHKAEREEFLA